MDERSAERLDGWSWAIFFVRWVLGLIFFMAGWWKTFDLGPAGRDLLSLDSWLGRRWARNPNMP
jgi:uncharacterized membrane protein YphA (DoxX/SURF4 family)